MTRPATRIMSRLSASATFSWPTSTLPDSASAIFRVTSGTVPPTIAAAVAYAANAPPNSSTTPPSSDGREHRDADVPPELPRRWRRS